jgi:hypothetical protein
MNLVKLNVGGQRFLTSVSTLTANGTANNFFTAMLSARIPCVLDDDGYYFIDRNGRHFEPLLDYLRTGGQLEVPDGMTLQRLVEEAHYYNILPSRHAYRPQRDVTKAGVSDHDLLDLESDSKLETEAQQEHLIQQHYALHQDVFDRLKARVFTALYHRRPQLMTVWPPKHKLHAMFAQLRETCPNLQPVTTLTQGPFDDEAHAALVLPNRRAAFAHHLRHHYDLTVSFTNCLLGVHTRLKQNPYDPPPRSTWELFQPTALPVNTDQHRYLLFRTSNLNAFLIKWTPARGKDGSGKEQPHRHDRQQQSRWSGGPTSSSSSTSLSSSSASQQHRRQRNSTESDDNSVFSNPYAGENGGERRGMSLLGDGI